ncbi:hypothetical protein PN437_00585 [Microcystis aeruginosa CS-564/01]|uniref:hypothetical protein n=1 Tax=Microcystis aeruginosa TaxID=1126 RepID=UPI00233064C2|nr:hypothetical protein [Microcystis aeruginosa]MDB9423447.1 hypothetical protein [Microcystis aeruginosa CS-564/01]
MISLTYIGLIDLCVLCVFVVRSTPSLGGMYLRIHFTHQIQESLPFLPLPGHDNADKRRFRG